MDNLSHRYARHLVSFIIVILFTASLWQLITANWIQGKAIIAQHLLDASWKKTLAVANPADADTPAIHRPWPWADTWPVARLIIPQHEIDQIILAGDSGSSLAFGPGYSLASAEPNTPGTTMLSGHRDTHFSFLEKLRLNDIIVIQTARSTVSYKVNEIQIVDSTTFRVQNIDYFQNLVLVTCYPFNTLTTGGTSRYLVYATAMPDNRA